MTVIFKSDKSFNYPQLMQVAQGISMDFRQNKFTNNGAPLSINDVITNTTVNTRGLLGFGGSYTEVAAGVNKLALNPVVGKRGLHKEGATPVNLLASVATNLPATHTANLNGSGVAYYVLSMQGSGSITISSSGVADRVLTQDKGVAIKVADLTSTQILLTKSGNISYVALHAAPKYSAVPVNRNLTGAALAGDEVNVKSSLLGKVFATYVFDISIPEHIYSSDTARNAWLFRIAGTGFSMDFGFSTTSKKLLVEGINSTNARSYLSSRFAIKSNAVIAVKVDGMTVSVFYNGEKLGNIVFDVALKVENIVFASERVKSTEVEGAAYIHQTYADMAVKSDAELMLITA